MGHHISGFQSRQLGRQGGIRFFLKANQGNKGTDFKFYMNSATVVKWIINTQFKGEK